MNDLAAFAQDMDEMHAAQWHKRIEEDEERLEGALKRMVGHRSNEADHQLIVAFCGMSERVYGAAK